MLARRLLVGLDEGGEGLRDLPVIQLVDCKVAGKLDEPSPEGNEPVVGSLGLLLERLGNAPLQPVAVLVGNACAFCRLVCQGMLMTAVPSDLTRRLKFLTALRVTWTVIVPVVRS